MGQAKLRQAAANNRIPDEVLSKLSNALKKLCLAASERYGSDCAGHAVLAQAFLKKLGYTTSLEAGYAAWRVGNGDSDVILHAPMPNMPAQPGAIAFHAWLKSGEYILDFTTYQLLDKAVQLDALDGGKTQVDWCPDYLYTNIRDLKPLQDVVQLETGMYFYQKDAKVHALVAGAITPADETELFALQNIYDNPDVFVHGPSGNSEQGHTSTNQLKPKS